MKYVEVVAHSGSTDTVVAIAQNDEASDIHLGLIDDEGRQSMRILVADHKLQPLLDALQKVIGSQAGAKIAVLPIEIALPKSSDEERREEDSAAAAREALYAGVEKNSHLDQNFIVLLVLSTIVAAIGLIESNVAVIIGAMVIAPLLGPNLAFGLGTALGDLGLMRQSALTNVAGLGLAIVMSLLVAMIWSVDIQSPELLARTDVGLDSVALALASGAAAALSLTTGLSSVLVGVMVAVALLPPAVTFGIMLGNGDMTLATGAGLLLAVNVVCVNLSCKVVFFVKGIRPRTWWEKKKASKAMSIYIVAWILTLVVLIAVIFGRDAIVP